MAGNIPKLVDKGFQNWIKANLALNFTKEGIEDAVLSKIHTFHQEILKDILSPEQIKNNDLCKQCKTENIIPCPTRSICRRPGDCPFHGTQQYRPCPKRVCDRLREKIKQCHKYNGPTWKNTKAENWCQKPWELAKCYLPPDGYLGVSSIAQTDINGIVSVIMNHSAFENKVDMYTCGQVREITRRLRHSPDICINDQDMKNFFDTLNDFLSCSSLFQGDVNAAASVQKITKLKTDSLTISTSDVTKVLQDVIQENTKKSLQVSNEKQVESARELKGYLDELNEVASKSIQAIFTAKASSIQDIESTKRTAKDDVQESKRIAITDVENTGTTATDTVLETKRIAITHLENTGRNTVDNIVDTKRIAITDVENARRTAIDNVVETKKTAITDVENAERTAVDKVKETERIAITDVENTGRTAIDTIKSTTDQLKTEFNRDIDKAKTQTVAEIEAMTQISVETEYQRLKADFKTDLLAFNQQYHSKIPLSSVFEEHETHLQDFYVPPAMNSIEVQRPTLSGPAEEVRKPITCLQDVFYRRSKPCSNIYLTSGAGQGKTVFCKKLVFTWCNAHHNHSSEKKLHLKDMQIMKGFEYAFLLHLRNSTVQCDVDDMISNQIVQNLSQHSNYSSKFLQTLLHREKCLILLDGLDEWSHSESSVITCTKPQDGLPHRKARANCTILTTTRSWKLSIVTLKSSQIDNHIEIGYLDDNSSRQLIANAVRKILDQDDTDTSDNDGINSHIDDITSKIHSSSTPEFEMNPLILTYMIGLLCDGKSLGQSKSGLYANIIDFLLHRWEKRNQCNTKVVFAGSGFVTVLPPAVFKHSGHIKTYEKFLLLLGQLAFKALFCENKEQSLFFKCSLVDSCLSEDEQKFCLSTGLLIKNKLPGRLTTNETRVSFSHKTFQEYFAALYIYSVNDINDVKESLLEKCNSVEKILEMSNVFVYLSGLCAERLHILSKELSKTINSDEMITKYRCGNSLFFPDSTCYKAAKSLQGMYIACVKESEDANHESVIPILQDIIIDDRYCNEEGYLQRLQKLITNVKHIKSIWLSHCNSNMNSQKLIKNLNLENIHRLESLFLLCPILSDDFEQILGSSVSTLVHLSASSIVYENGLVSLMESTLSDTSVKLIRDMKYLTSLNLFAVMVSHCVLESLISYLTQRTCMKQITLIKIKCIDHGLLCPGFSMDLSQHVELDTVGLSELPIAHVEINTSALEQCYAGPLYTSSSLSSFLTNNCLHNANNLRFIVFSSMNSENDLNIVIDTIPRLINAKGLHLMNTDIKNKVLKLSSDNANIKCILMENVSMTSSSLEQLVGQIEHFQQSIHLYLANCTVTPVEEYVRITYHIKSSGRFEVIRDGECENLIGTITKSFEIRTIRH